MVKIITKEIPIEESLKTKLKDYERYKINI